MNIENSGEVAVLISRQSFLFFKHLCFEFGFKFAGRYGNDPAMKKFNLLFAAGLLFSAYLMGFTAIRTGGIQGKILPAAGVSKVIAISGKDTLLADLKNGNIVFRNVKAATYTLLVETKTPYKGTSVENVAVIDSTITDIGEIHLEQ